MHLGNRAIQKETFPHLQGVIKSFTKLSEKKREEAVPKTLLDWIQAAKEPCFLLPAVLEFIEAVESSAIIPHYTFSHFELWLNQSSGLSFEENRRVRGKIVGKWVSRSEYQVFFPVGMGKVYEGTHFVTAHKSPDLDTTVASFWGWVDAFGARVGNGLHVWNLPGGPPSSQIEIEWVFRDRFGPAVFTHLPKTRTALNITARDLMTRDGMSVKLPSEAIAGIDHEREHCAVVVVDAEGVYLGDWRSFDVEEVRQVIILISMCLRWFENRIYLNLISLFAKEKPQFESIRLSVSQLFSLSIHDCEPAKECTQKQRKDVRSFLSHVLGFQEGFEGSFEKLSAALGKFAGVSILSLESLLQRVKPLFSSKGELLEERSKIFIFLEEIVRELHSGILAVRIRLEKLDIALKTKSDVFGHHPTFVNVRSDIEEIRQKIGSYVSLTVTDTKEGALFPSGIILASDVRKNILGTVSLRDFCNPNEMTIPSYLDIISVIDHHKSQLQTSMPPFAILSDAQSSNSLVATQAFLLNDRHSLCGQTKEAIEEQILTISQQKTPVATRLLQRLLRKRSIAAKSQEFFIHPEREYTEYLHFLYAILDDTDLLSKVSSLDVECVVSLLNRMKSIAAKEEVEVLTLADLPQDGQFLKKAAQRILQNEEMYSLYVKVYEHREHEIEEHIELAANGKPSHLFADTKVQNGCCRIGQTKVFPRNIAKMFARVQNIQKWWTSEALRIFQEHKEIDLHIHMVSTIVSADEVYRGEVAPRAHQDEMWLWIPPEQEIGVEHFKRFLVAFRDCPGLKGNQLTAEVVGLRAEEFREFIEESLPDVPVQVGKGESSLLILRYKAGSLNSRKAMVAPFLPSL